MTQRIFHTTRSVCRTVLLLLVLWAVAAPRAVAVPWTAMVQPRGQDARSYPVIRTPFGSMPDLEMLNAMAPQDMTLPLPGVGTGGCCPPLIRQPIQPIVAWPTGYPPHVVATEDPAWWVACLNAQNAAGVSRLFEIVGAPSNVMGLVPATSDPCSQLNPEPMGWTPGWNLPDPRPAYIIREGHVLITIPDWGGPDEPSPRRQNPQRCHLDPARTSVRGRIPAVSDDQSDRVPPQRHMPTRNRAENTALPSDPDDLHRARATLRERATPGHERHQRPRAH